MHKLTTSMALLTIVGALATPALAAPNDPGTASHPPGFCAQNPKDPFCIAQAKKGDHHGTQPNGSSDGSQQGGDQGSSSDTHHSGTSQTDHTSHNNDNGPGAMDNSQGGMDQGYGGRQHDNNRSGDNPYDQPQNGGNMGSMGQWSHRDSDQFHQRFHNFNFGFFAPPSFGIQLGVRVPHSYDLHPVPRSITRYYPRFRGYLFFATRHGDVVIVSPSTRRVVAIL